MTDKHATARAMYEDYLARSAVLERLRRYATDVTTAISGSGQTPVEPLATMGKHGGPLLCDVCRKPMVLEGGLYNRVTADKAWQRNQQPGWKSYIAGGMVVRIETNGTLRIFHGYPGRSGCVTTADRDDDLHRERFRPGDVSAKLEMLSAYFKAELPENDRDAVLGEIHAVLFAYDPGLGVNSPA